MRARASPLIAGCDFMVSGRRDNAKFGKLWQKEWDFKQVQYEFGQELTPEQRAKLAGPVRCRPRVARSLARSFVCLFTPGSTS